VNTVSASFNSVIETNDGNILVKKIPHLKTVFM